MDQQLLAVFFESLHAATIIPYASEATLAGMRGFGKDLTLAVPAAIVGATIGQSLNVVLGTYLLTYAKKRDGITGKDGYRRAHAMFHRYIVYALLFSWMPLFNFFSVAAGFFTVRFKIALPLLLIGQAIHYGWYLL